MFQKKAVRRWTWKSQNVKINANILVIFASSTTYTYALIRHMSYKKCNRNYLMKVKIRVWRWTSPRQRRWWKTAQQYMSITLRSWALKATSPWDRDKNQDKEIQRRITTGWTVLAKHRDLFTGNIEHAWRDKSTTPDTPITAIKGLANFGIALAIVYDI